MKDTPGDVKRFTSIIQGMYDEAGINEQDRTYIHTEKNAEGKISAQIDITPFLDNPKLIRDALRVNDRNQKMRYVAAIVLGSAATSMSVDMFKRTLRQQRNPEKNLAEVLGAGVCVCIVEYIRGDIYINTPDQKHAQKWAENMMHKIRGFYEDKGRHYCEMNGIDLESDIQTSYKVWTNTR